MDLSWEEPFGPVERYADIAANAERSITASPVWYSENRRSRFIIGRGNDTRIGVFGARTRGSSLRKSRATEIHFGAHGSESAGPRGPGRR